MMNLNSPFRSVSDAIQKVIVPFAAKQKDRRSDLLNCLFYFNSMATTMPANPVWRRVSESP
jgi:hypothetical protein